MRVLRTDRLRDVPSPFEFICTHQRNLVSVDDPVPHLLERDGGAEIHVPDQADELAKAANHPVDGGFAAGAYDFVHGGFESLDIEGASRHITSQQVFGDETNQPAT